MWFVFPQIAGLGTTEVSRFYAIENAAEARDYMQHPVLGRRLTECSEILLSLKAVSANEIFGSPDDAKLRSSMTLFASVSPAGSPFANVINRYFGGAADQRTLDILEAGRS